MTRRNLLFRKHGKSSGSLPTLRQSLKRIHLKITVVSLLLSGLVISTLSLFALRNYAENNLQLVAATVGYTSQAAVVFDDRVAAQEILTVFGRRGQFSSGKIYNNQNNLLASWQSPNQERYTGMDELIRDWLFPHSVMAPVIHNQHEVGQVWLVGDASEILHYIYRALSGLGMSLFFTALFASLLSNRMHAGILSGLQNIATVAHDVRKYRAFWQRVPSAGIAELNDLSNDFNSLLEELEEWQNHLKRENDTLVHQATHDALTGLPNRVAFERKLQRYFDDKALRDQIAVLFIDGDRFKQVNDTWGHAAGDSVLIKTAQRLRSHVRHGDLVARLGGDEFAILLDNIQSDDQVTQIANKLMLAMEAPIILPQGEEVYQSLSIGIALAKYHPSPQEVMAKADTAMYHIKDMGGGWYLSPSSWGQEEK